MPIETKVMVGDNNLIHQVHKVSSPFNEAMFIKSIQSIVSDKVFEELINKEKHSLIITFTIDVVE